MRFIKIRWFVFHKNHVLSSYNNSTKKGPRKIVVKNKVRSDIGNTIKSLSCKWKSVCRMVMRKD